MVRDGFAFFISTNTNREAKEMKEIQTIYINVALHRRFRQVVQSRGMKIGAAAEMAITDWIKKVETKPGRGVGALIETAEAE